MRATALLVDDEDIVRTGLRRRLPWARVGIELVGTAANGREALAVLRASPVDIVITDIVMPGLDGLRLIERARRLPTPPVFVVLSGYDEFAFAQRAMLLGVRHYVLKPTRLPELIRVLEEVAAQVKRDRQERQRAARLQRLRDEEQPLTRTGALAKAVAGRRLPAGELDAIGRCLGVRRDRDRLCVVLVQAGTWSAGQVADLEVIAGRVFGTRSVVGAVESEGVACLVVRSGAGAPAENALEDLCARLARLGRSEVRLACTDPFPLAELARARATARSCLQHSFYAGSQRVIRCSDVPMDFCRQAPPALADHLRQVREAVETADAAALHGPLAAAFALAGERLLDPAELRTACLNLLVDLADRLGKDAWEPLRASVTRLAEAGDAHRLEEEVRSCLKGIIAEIRPLSRTPAQRMVEALVDAVNRRFAEHGLSLKKLCATSIFASEDYAGRVFRAATGVRFSEYLSRARMEEARRLLEAFPNMNVAEVARRTGYGGNSQYFSTVFRRNCGMTPKNWRRSSSPPARRSVARPATAAEKRTNSAEP
jgi:two-component system response regulator YesN